MSRVSGGPFPMSAVEEPPTARRLLLPYDGIVTIDTTGVAKTLWDCRDRNFGEQPRIAGRIWLTAYSGNGGSVFLGSRYVDETTLRGLELPPGERFPPFGPLSLEDWWVNGTAGYKLQVLYWPANDGPYLDGQGRMAT